MSSFADGVAGALRDGRVLAQSLMVDRCTITRDSGETTTDPETGVVTPVPGATVYSGKCRVQMTAETVEESDSGERRSYLSRVVVSVPVSSVRYEDGDLVQVTGSRFDKALVGRRFRVQSVVAKSFTTARRLHCEEGV